MKNKQHLAVLTTQAQAGREEKILVTCKLRNRSMVIAEMHKALKAYGEVLRLVRHLPQDTRPYYAKYARENFVNYRQFDSNDPNALQDLFNRTYTHSLWVLNKVGPPLALSVCMY